MIREAAEFPDKGGFRTAGRYFEVRRSENKE
jgi:hypothetical protein